MFLCKEIKKDSSTLEEILKEITSKAFKSDERNQI